MEKPDETIPASAMIACPKLEGLVSVRETCIGCELHHAIGVLNDHPDVPWNVGHRVLCNLPRKIAIMVRADG